MPNLWNKYNIPSTCSLIYVWPNDDWCTLDDLGEALEFRSDDYLVVPVPEDWEEDLLDAVVKVVNSLPPVPVRVIHKSTPEAILSLASGDVDRVWVSLTDDVAYPYKDLQPFLRYLPKDIMFSLHTEEP